MGGSTTSKAHPLTTALLPVIAVLLGLNLSEKASPTAEGQVGVGLQKPMPLFVSAVPDEGDIPESRYRVFRTRSDGNLDWVCWIHDGCSEFRA